MFSTIFRERRGEEGEREKYQCEKYRLVVSCTHLDWGLNPQPGQMP